MIISSLSRHITLSVSHSFPISLASNLLTLVKVPCAVAVRAARAVTDEIPSARHTSLGSLARIPDGNCERDTHRLSKKYKLALPIKRSMVRVAGEKIQFLKMSSWANFLMEKNLWHHLAGLKAPDHDRCEAIWSLFWQRFKAICPGHDIFKRPGHDLSRTCALLVHGDEGRSARKAPILVVSAHSILGYGLSTAQGKKENDKYTGMKLNYKEPTWTTRFLLGVLPRRMYADDDGEETDAFQDFLGGITLDLESLYENGVMDPMGRKFYFCAISVMGDWPWIQKAGCLGRSFFNAAKRSSSRTIPKGICHMCLADQPGYPWEDWVSQTPAWVSTINTVSPFVREPALLALAKDDGDKPSLFSYDLFHTWHLGCGRTFVASAIVVLATSKHFEGSMASRVEAVSGLFESWCSRNKVRPYMKKITQAKLSWLTNADYPQGTWSKGSTTTFLMRWFVDECRSRRAAIAGDSDQLLQITFEAAQAAHSFLRRLYHEEVWIPSNTASVIADKGLLFLRKHGEAIRMAFGSSRNLFLQMPNLHRFHHIAFQLKWQSQSTDFVFNALALSSQSDEDFIGRPSRISRRVHARTVVERTLQRSLEAAYAKWVDAKLIILDKEA
jgi:hypothetical protein